MRRLALTLFVLFLFFNFIGCERSNPSESSQKSNDTMVGISDGETNKSLSKITPENPVLSENEVTEDFSQYFVGYEGCFILFDEKKNEYVIYNQIKSREQVSPCSTFKIANSLIGLESKVLVDENTTFQWDGKKYPIESWNRNQNLKTAVPNSVVWFFQRLAVQVGKEKMQDYLNKFHYGNRDISGGLTNFWLQSSLKISPKEQVDFLRKFYHYQLPVSKESIDTVKRIIIISDKKGVKLSGKTGSGAASFNSQYCNGWFTGYIEHLKSVYFFATNIESDHVSGKNAGGAEAKDITLKIIHDHFNETDN